MLLMALHPAPLARPTRPQVYRTALPHANAVHHTGSYHPASPHEQVGQRGTPILTHGVTYEVICQFVQRGQHLKSRAIDNVDP
jgi:hypothetical protein